MLRFLFASVLAQIILLASPDARADGCVGGTCVPPEDMQVFLQALREKKCLTSTTPKFDLDPVKIVVDRDGRVFFSGSEPSPYTLRMTWCNYEVTGKGKLVVAAAVQEPPTWGFRFRPKAYTGLLLSAPFYQETDSFGDVVDAGLMVDVFHVHQFNLNFHTGFRSVGMGLGMDITRNFGAYTGYALTWEGWRHNVELGLWFSFW